jgi:UDP-N-acetyl-D-glucosamine dehydrogenase
MSKVVVAGQGYVGLPLSMRATAIGHDVVGLDTAEDRVKALRAGESYVDDVSDERLTTALESGRFLPSSSYCDAKGFSVAVITVPTPLRRRSPDLSCVEDCVRELAPYVTRGSLVVLESTTYPGTTEELVTPLLEAGSGLIAGRDFSVGYSPERIDPGNPTWTLVSTPKVISGIDRTSLAAATAFYEPLVAKVVPVSSTRAAELTKLLENTFRHVNIALVNELAIFARELGIDVWEVVDAATTKPFGFMRFTPGPGVGGHCLPIDPAYLAWHVKQATGSSFRFVELANDINEHMPDYVVQRLTLGLNRLSKPVRGSEILLIGLAYKKNSADARESPAARVVELLNSLGARVTAYDPHVSVETQSDVARPAALTAEVVRAADAVVVLADHDDCDYKLVEREAQWVLDCRHRMYGENVESL